METTGSTVAFLAFLLTIVSLNSSCNADIVYKASSTSAANKFTTQIGLDYSLKTMVDASSFIWTTFHQSETERRNKNLVTLTIESMNGVAYTSNDVIHFSAEYLENYSGDVKFEFTGVLYHEMTHVWQWDGNGGAPTWLVEGIADYVRLKSGYVTGNWVKPGEGEKWDQGYGVTARFLDYCDSYRMQGFVANMNRKMKDGYSDGYFVELLGNSVDQLWNEYKAKYSG